MGSGWAMQAIFFGGFCSLAQSHREALTQLPTHILLISKEKNRHKSCQC